MSECLYLTSPDGSRICALHGSGPCRPGGSGTLCGCNKVGACADCAAIANKPLIRRLDEPAHDLMLRVDGVDHERFPGLDGLGALDALTEHAEEYPGSAVTLGVVDALRY